MKRNDHLPESYSPHNNLIFLGETISVALSKLVQDQTLTIPSPCLLVGLEHGEDNKLSVAAKNQSFSASSILFPANTEIMVRADYRLTALIILDGRFSYYEALKNTMTPVFQGIFCNMAKESEFIELLKSSYSAQVKEKEFIKRLEAFLEEIPLFSAEPIIDPRIMRVVTLLRSRPDQAYSLKQLAEEATLSSSRLTALFKLQVGAPLRKYRIWVRLYVVAREVAKGKTFIESCSIAGFTDGPHFTNTFKSMFGVSPIQIFNDKTRIFME